MVVQRVEVEVAQQRADHRPLRTAAFRSPGGHPLQDSLAEKALHQREHAAVRDLFAEALQQEGVRDRVEIALQVGVHHIGVAGLQQGIDATQGVFGAAARAEAVALLGKFPLEDRLQHVSHRRLHHPVLNRGNAQRAPLAAARLGNIDPSNRLGTIAAVLQAVSQSFQVRLQVLGIAVNRLMIHAGRSAVGGDLAERRLEIGGRVDLVDQAEPVSSFHPVFQGRQHAVGPDRRFGPRPAGTDLFDLLSPAGH